MPTAGQANRRYFRRAYRTGEHGWAIDEPSPYAVRFLRRLGRLLGPAALLDVGCGEGRHAIAAAKLGFKVTAIDYEPLALKRARRLARDSGARRIVFKKADALHLPFGRESFGVVLDCGCLHHQRKSDWPAYKRSMLRVLAPGGYYALSVFSPRFHMFRGRRRNWHIAQGAYRRCFTPAEIRKLFAREFEVLELQEEKDRNRGLWHVLMRRRG